MNIVMLSNTYRPHVGGVARSVESFANEFRNRGHRVLVVAPEFHNQPDRENDVLRIPALQNFNGSDFSVVLPVSGLLNEELNRFQPDIVHAHHPFLLGMTALRIARYRGLPLVFTHHTLYERYTHYVPADSVALKRFVIELATQYGNLADRVFAPSESIAALLRQRQVRTPIEVIPTGVHLASYADANGATFRSGHNIPPDAFLIGHLGRLAPEKNLRFLVEAIALFMENDDKAHFLLVGVGPMLEELTEVFKQRHLGQRFHSFGLLSPKQQSDAYNAMDVFAFASKSETQGMVLTEAMAAGVPVVALDASGAREVVKDRENGRLLFEEDVETFAGALRWLRGLDGSARLALKSSAQKTAELFSMTNSATRALHCYQTLLGTAHQGDETVYQRWLRL
ncbi:MAG TPA: glycosyl transferase family 1, partial [Porticoccaceae bacterium]|nr:glycosyl transferase family 1 [Porticoccaceae bacterium]